MNNGNNNHDTIMDDYDEDAEMMDNNASKKQDKPRRGSRLSDQVTDMEDEPALQGYERYVEWNKMELNSYQ